MSYQIQWMIENQVIYSRVWDSVDEQELRTMLDEANAMQAQSNTQSVYVINDSRELLITLPLHKQLQIFRDYRSHTRHGWTLMVGQKSTFQKFVATSAARIFGLNLRLFDTPEEAIAYLQRIAPFLHWDKVTNPVEI